MKAGLLLAAGSLVLGTGQCAIHKLKLQKIPLSEQLKHADIATHAQALYNKYSGQKAMGPQFAPSNEQVFRDTSIHPESPGHTVPIENFLNAQCKIFQV